MTDIPYLDTLRSDLVGGIERRGRRIARRRRTALVGAPLALSAAVVAATVPGGASPALAIDREGDWIELRIADVAATENEMEHELEAVGIDAEIRLVPATEPLVGRWACVAELADGDPAGPDLDGAGPNGAGYVVRLNEVGYTPTTVRIRRDFARGTQDGRLVFVAGRGAGSGERASADPCRDTVVPPRRGAPGRP
ncbi:MAG TPA: hypothetical protein VGV90_17395 [Solirubrobacteraceae bacterium]|nr:hypothetical protein [Solirubrobacteraceae bacterium]